jgi:hypothetical protein
MPRRRHPHLYELNARLVIERQAALHGRRLAIGAIPEAEWRRLGAHGFDLVWPMGIWRRSDASRRIAREHPGLRVEYDRVLPGWDEGDVGGSPYAVADYAIDPAIGGPDDLVRLRRALDRCGLGLIVDFVPNHLAVDHPWVRSHPERLVAGTPQAVRDHPDRFFSPRPGLHLAYGRDPYSSPWTDTVQINHFAGGAREALGDDLLQIAALADGVRCDMAMLVLDDAFRATWSGVVAAVAHVNWPDFWPEAMARVKQRFPGFLFIAEAYRDVERLLAMGFDYIYDKGLYDRLLQGDAGAVREHLAANPSDRFVRFIENHDEPRAAQAFGPARSRAAAIVAGTSPGCRLFHDGQAEGRRVRLPVQLIREPDEPADPDTALFHDRLLRILDAPVFHSGEHRLLEVTPAGDPGAGHRNLLAWSWEEGGDLRIVVVNYSGMRSSGRLRFRLPPPRGGSGDPDRVDLDDLLHDVSYQRDRHEVADPGLYVELPPWDAHLFRAR